MDARDVKPAWELLQRGELSADPALIGKLDEARGQTLHLGPEELLVAAKIEVDAGESAAEVARAIDAAEQRVRAVEPIARQIYLEPDLFFAGVRPAINVGISVSRVGGNAQRKAMKKVAGSLRLDLAAFRDLEAFSQLGTELDTATQRQLDRGQRMVELLKQAQYKPFNVNEEVLSIFAGTRGFLDDVPVKDVPKFEAALIKHFADEHPEIVATLDRTRDLPNDLAEKIGAVIRDFKTQWKA